jgi:hypothetical protein
VIGRGTVGRSAPCRVSSRLEHAALKEVIVLVEASPQGGYEARALGHSIFTDGDDLEQLKANATDAVSAHFDAEERLAVIRLHRVKAIVIAA